MCVAPNPINNITVFLSRFLFHLARREKEVYPRFIDSKKLILNLVSLTSPGIQETHSIFYFKRLYTFERQSFS